MASVCETVVDRQREVILERWKKWSKEVLGSQFPEIFAKLPPDQSGFYYLLGCYFVIRADAPFKEVPGRGNVRDIDPEKMSAWVKKADVCPDFDANCTQILKTIQELTK